MGDFLKRFVHLNLEEFQKFFGAFLKMIFTQFDLHIYGNENEGKFAFGNVVIIN